MIYNFKLLRKQILGLPLSEANFESRGFDTGYPAQDRLEMVAGTVVNAYNITVEHGLGDDLKNVSKGIKEELQGFHFEGVAMGIYTLDIFSFGRKGLFWKYLESLESNHEYMSYIGAGLALGVFKRPFAKLLEKGDPGYACLALDGIGFYYAMFETKKLFSKKFVPKSIRSNPFYQRRYDNGIGRAIWFYNSGEPDNISNTINSFPESRRSALWSGVGLAAEYAGGVAPSKIEKLKKLSGEHYLYLGQGAALAAHTRGTAGNPHIDESTVKILTGRDRDSCHLFLKGIMDRIRGKRTIDGKQSFEYLVQEVRGWMAQSQVEETTRLKKIV